MSWSEFVLARREQHGQTRLTGEHAGGEFLGNWNICVVELMQFRHSYLLVLGIISFCGVLDVSSFLALGWIKRD